MREGLIVGAALVFELAQFFELPAEQSQARLRQMNFSRTLRTRARYAAVERHVEIEFERRHRTERHEFFGRVAVEAPVLAPLVRNHKTEMFGILSGSRPFRQRGRAETMRPRGGELHFK